MEQVLPRPRAGLMARMLRLAPLPAAAASGCDRPVHLLPAGAEVHMTLLVHQARAARAAPHRRPAVLDGPRVPSAGVFALEVRTAVVSHSSVLRLERLTRRNAGEAACVRTALCQAAPPGAQAARDAAAPAVRVASVAWCRITPPHDQPITLAVPPGPAASFSARSWPLAKRALSRAPTTHGQPVYRKLTSG